MAEIPFPSEVQAAPLVTISLSKLIEGDCGEEERLYEASKKLGFFYLKLQGCNEGETLLQDVGKLFSLNESFFELPLEVKQEYDFASQGKYFGYKGMGAEVIDGKGTKDRNEIYNISKDDILELSESLPAPELVSTNRGLVRRYIEENYRVLSILFNTYSKTMNLPKSTFTSLHRLEKKSGCHVRFIRAPPQPPDDRKTALGEHTDFGSLTILFNRIGGLQVLLPNTTDWVYVKPVPGCAIVNIGDAMVKFSAGILRSNLHRVISPPGGQANLVRHSLVYFCRPEHDVVLQRLHGGHIDKVPVSGNDDGETMEDWLKRRHLGRKMQYFQGEESWEKSKGTEGSRLISAS